MRNHENSWGKDDNNALQTRFGIIGLVNYYQKQNNKKGILQLDDQNWKEAKELFDRWFGEMRFQQQIQAKHLFASTKNNIRHFNFIKATIKIFDLIRLDPWFWKYRGCNFFYPRDVKCFLKFSADRSKTIKNHDF